MAQTRARFEIFEGRGGQFYWRFRARNGAIVADGAEGYTTRYGAKRAVRRLKDLVWGGAEVVNH